MIRREELFLVLYRRLLYETMLLAVLVPLGVAGIGALSGRSNETIYAEPSSF